MERASAFLHEEIIDIATDRIIFENKKRVALIPIPMKEKDERSRGWNQSLELCRAIENYNKIHGNSEIFVSDVLRKMKQTKHQRNLTRNERLANIKNSMKRVGNLPLDSLPIIIDDVTTTSATIFEARRALGEKDALAITLAH